MLAILVYYLISDATFSTEFFKLSLGTFVILGVIGSFILPDRIAWVFQACMATFWLFGLLFVKDDSVAPGSDTVPAIVLIVVFYLLAFLTFKRATKRTSV